MFDQACLLKYGQFQTGKGDIANGELFWEQVMGLQKIHFPIDRIDEAA